MLNLSKCEQSSESKASFESECLPLRDDLLGFAKKLAGGDEARAADVVQDALLKAFLAWERFDPRGRERTQAVRAWLYRNVANTYMKDYRYRKYRRSYVDSHDEIVEATYGTRTNDLRDAVDSMYGDEVQAAISELKPEFWDTFQRFYVQGQTCEQIAAELGVPENTVSTRLLRARRAIGDKVADYAEREYGIKSSVRGTRKHTNSVKATKAPQPDADCVHSIMGRDDSAAFDIGQSGPDALASG